jgi:hypothetical protein
MTAVIVLALAALLCRRRSGRRHRSPRARDHRRLKGAIIRVAPQAAAS